jgi:hypothetical protein
MSESPKYLFAHVRHPDDFRPEVTSVVLFGLASTDGQIFYLEIRYIDFEKNIIEGDHLMWSLEEAYECALRDYGVREADWRPLSKVEIEKIESGMG